MQWVRPLWTRMLAFKLPAPPLPSCVTWRGYLTSLCSDSLVSRMGTALLLV